MTDLDNNLVLIVMNQSVDWMAGRGLFVLELLDNGSYAGGQDNYHLIAGERYDRLPGDVPAYTGWDLSDFKSFEADFIPEPSTMLLLGTAALGLIGYVRRRRMR